MGGEVAGGDVPAVAVGADKEGTAIGLNGEAAVAAVVIGSGGGDGAKGAGGGAGLEEGEDDSLDLLRSRHLRHWAVPSLYAANLPSATVGVNRKIQGKAKKIAGSHEGTR